MMRPACENQLDSRKTMGTSEKVSAEMRRLLAVNRDGKLTSDQWLAAVFEPIAPILLVMTPLIVLLAWRAGRVGVLLGLGICLLLTTWLGLTRMIRYARLPIYHAVMTASKNFQPMRVFGPPTLTDKDGQTFVFKRRYTPKFNLNKDMLYSIYWLYDGNAPVLLSLSPSDHPNAMSWKPSPVFEARLERRLARREGGAN